MTDYYQTHYQEYFDRTVAVDPAGFLKPFIQRLRPGASVLDIGCGSGRDLLWLKDQGFSATGFERSAGLAALARRHSGCDVIEGDFETFDFSTLSFDAIMASGAFVHLPHHRLSPVLNHIRKTLVPGGFFYLSVKQGDSARTDSKGRIFYAWRDAELRKFFRELQYDVVFFDVSLSALGTGDHWLGYILEQV